jgi:hypothetical protein
VLGLAGGFRYAVLHCGIAEACAVAKVVGTTAGAAGSVERTMTSNQRPGWAIRTQRGTHPALYLAASAMQQDALIFR